MSKLATIEEIKVVEKHPNADSLDIVTVLGYQAIVRRDVWKVGDLCIFIQPDTILPDNQEWAAFYKSKSSRVKSIKLRGSWSMGIVEALSILPKYESPELVPDEVRSPLPGVEVSHILGVTKFEPPAPSDLSAKGNMPDGLFKTDEERYQNLDAIPFSELADVTLKIDGSSMTVYAKLSEDKTAITEEGITSRSLTLKPECCNKYTAADARFSLLEKLKAYCLAHRVSLALRGELYGEKIQAFPTNPHAGRTLSFAAYSVWNFDTMRYEGPTDAHYFRKICEEYNIESVPVLETQVHITPELIAKYDSELKVLPGLGHEFEGVVLKLAEGRSFKIINKHYDASK